MNNLFNMIKQLKEETPRVNYLFMRRRIEKGNGHKTLGWIMQKENNTTSENVDIMKLIDERESDDNVKNNFEVNNERN